MLAAPLLIVEVAPGADASPEASLTAFHEQTAAESDGTGTDVPADTGESSDDADAVGRAVGSVTSADLTATRLLSTLTVGDELRAEAEAEEAAAREAAERAAAEAEAAEREAAEAEARAATTTTTTAPPPPPPPPPPPAESVAPPSDGPTAEQWAALRRCESGGNYGAINWAGPYYGAYQFSQATWNGTARNAGRGDLVGVRPDHAAPADQDAMAYALYARRGSSPWPNCGVHLH